MQESQLHVHAVIAVQHPALADPGIGAQFHRRLAIAQRGNARIADLAGPLQPHLHHRAEGQRRAGAGRVAQQIDIEVGAAHLEIEPVDLALHHSARLERGFVGPFVVRADPAAQADGQAVAVGRGRRALRRAGDGLRGGHPLQGKRGDHRQRRANEMQDIAHVCSSAPSAADIGAARRPATGQRCRSGQLTAAPPPPSCPGGRRLPCIRSTVRSVHPIR